MHAYLNVACCDKCEGTAVQESLDRMGLDSSLAVARARSRSRSRVGRKRQRSEGPAGMDIDDGAGGDVIMQPLKKRIHSSKSR